jgi:group I intron endonuclease
MNKGKIYKMVNTINDDVYIGCTIYALDKRFYEHLHRCFKSDVNTKLYNSIREFGAKNFTIELLEECPLSEISEKEKQYITQYDSFDNGLNSALGGEESIGYVHSNENLKVYSKKIEKIINDSMVKEPVIAEEIINQKEKKVTQESKSFLKGLKEKLNTINKKDPNLSTTVYYELKGNQKWKNK